MANFVPKFNAWRITFTFPLINQARHICFLVNANKNVALLDKVLAGDQQFPAAQVDPPMAPSPGFSVRLRAWNDSSFRIAQCAK